MNSEKPLNMFVDDIERKNKEFYHRTAIKNSKSKLIEYLTPELCTKLAKCIDIKSITALQSNNHTDIEVEPGGNTTENGSNENVDDNEYDFHDDEKDETGLHHPQEQFEVHIRPTITNPIKSTDLQRSWMANYLRKPRNDRILWESKLYKFERSYAAKSLPEKTEELMDLFIFETKTLLAAGDFADWLKSLGSDGKVNMNKDLIKKLFSIGIEDDAAKKALYVAPVIKSAIPEEIANIVRLPDLAIEKKVNRIMLDDKKLMKIEPKYVAFGRTLPPLLRLTKFEIEDRINKPNFPDNLRTNKVVFDGITHLRSTKILNDYLNQHPDVPKPIYLMETQGRKETAAFAENRGDYTPLYKIANKSKMS